MKRVLSFAVAFTLIVNQVGANCLAKEPELLQKKSQVEVQTKENLSQSDKVMKQIVDQVLAELKKREETNNGVGKEDAKSKSSLPVRVLKTLFKPVYWVGKAGAFILKQLFWLVHGSWLAIIASVGTTIAIFKTGSAGIKEAENMVNTVNESLVEMNKLMDHLKENPELADGILSRMFSLLVDCKKSMQPDEYKSYLKKVAMLFHPDKLKNLRNMPKEEANEIYQLTTELMSKN